MGTSSFKVNENLWLVRQKLDVGVKKVEVKTPVHHILMVDCSGSMWGELPKIREQLKKRLPKVLGEDDIISIIWFSGTGECGTLIESEKIPGLKDLTNVNSLIDRWLRPVGMTGFLQPIMEAASIINRTQKKYPNHAPSVLFLSDGHDNCSRRPEVLAAVEKLSKVASSSAFVEYGYYADRPLLTAMAEKAGGTLVFAEDFDHYVPAFEAIVQRKVVGAPRVEVSISGDPVRGFVWMTDGTDLVTYSVEGGKSAVTEGTQAIWYVSPKAVGDSLPLDLADVKKHFDAADATYAAIALFSNRMAPDIVLPLLKLTGDVAFIEQFGGLFGKQRYSEFMEQARAASFDPTKRLTKGFDPKKVPAEDAFTVLELLQLLASDDANRVLLDHPSFKYNRIGRARVDAVTVLSKEEQAEIDTLTDELKKTKDVKKAKEINSRISAITDKPEPLKFEQDGAPDGYPVSSLTYNEEKPNVSFLVRKAGTVDVSKAAPAALKLPAKFPTFVFRNYAVVKDGLVNVEVLPVNLSPVSLEELFKAHKDGRIADDVITSDGGVTFLNMKSLPVINRKMVKAVSAKDLFADEWALLKVQASQKVYNTAAKEQAVSKKSASFEDTYGADAAVWLKEQGFTDYSGFGPKSRQAESTDVYRAKELSVSVKGFSAIPSLNDFKKQIAKGKFTPSAALMESAWKDLEAFLATPDGKDSAKFETWVKGKQKVLDAERRSRILSKAQQVFSIVVGQVWPFPSIDEGTMELELDKQKLSFKLEAREVDIKI